jgi:heavy metal translocating P-type ATPase
MAEKNALSAQASRLVAALMLTVLAFIHQLFGGALSALLGGWLFLVELTLLALVALLAVPVLRQGLLDAYQKKRLSAYTLPSLGLLALLFYSLVAMVITYVAAPTQLYLAQASFALAVIMFTQALLARTAPEDEEKAPDLEPSALAPGDNIKVRPGETIPADGVIMAGSTRVDESSISGSKSPVKKTKGSVVYAGTKNINGLFVMKVESGKDSASSAIRRLTVEAASSRLPFQVIADRASELLILLTLAAAVLIGLLWAVFGLPTNAFLLFTSTLFIASPLALSLASERGVREAVFAAARKGVLFKSASALQKAGDVRMVVLSKTGILTEGKPVIKRIRAYKMNEESVLRYAASLQSKSGHPYAKAIVALADKRQVAYGDPRSFEEFAGLGVLGKVEGRKVLVGSLDFLISQGVGIYDARERLPEFAKEGLSPVLVALEGRLAAIIGIKDDLRADAKATVDALSKQGVQSVLLTGDDSQAASRLARELGITVVRAGLTPQAKLNELERLKKKRGVAVVGDVVSDAALMARADLGLALGRGGVTSEEVGVVLLSSGLLGVSSALSLARAAGRSGFRNIAFGFGYNGLFVLGAAGGLYALAGVMFSPALAVLFSAAALAPALLGARPVLRAETFL